MRFITASLLTCALMASTVIARNCVEGLYYCGSVLLQRGKYYDQIVAALEAENISPDPNDVDNSLFFCVFDNTTNGNIDFLKVCPNDCQNGGDGNSDYCKS